MSPNLTAFLTMIAACEGTGEAYNALFGYTPANGKVFDNGYVTHPRITVPFTNSMGNQQYSTAAGRYQIIYPTFARLQAKLGTHDFSPATQDLMAVELVKQASALDYVESGDLGAAVDACCLIWASLPGSSYPQPVRPYAFAEAAYRAAGGVVA